jgi:hypothetical protein
LLCLKPGAIINKALIRRSEGATMQTARNEGTSLEALHHERLEYFRASSHREIAVAAALAYCDEHRIDAPRWVISEAPDIICSLLKRERPRKRGRANSAIARFRQDMIDFMRWDEVLVACEKQAQQRDTIETLHQMRNVPPNVRAEQEKRSLWLGRTLDRAYECVSMMLQQTIAFGGKAAVKASYLQVEKNISRRPCRYMVLDYSILSKLGLGPLYGIRPVRKSPCIYDLTL